MRVDVRELRLYNMSYSSHFIRQRSFAAYKFNQEEHPDDSSDGSNRE